MLAWNFQLIQRMLPKVLFLWFAPSRVRGEGPVDAHSPITLQEFNLRMKCKSEKNWASSFNELKGPMQKFRHFGAKKLNGLKFDVRWFCCQHLNLYDSPIELFIDYWQIIREMLELFKKLWLQ